MVGMSKAHGKGTVCAGEGTVCACDSAFLIARRRMIRCNAESAMFSSQEEQLKNDHESW